VAKKTVLVVDDDAMIRGLVRAVLQREALEIEEAQTGHEAIKRLKEKRYDAVVLDIMMGDGSGHEVLEALAEQRPNVKCVVVISAMSAPNIENIASLNVHAKLRKPFDINDLLQAVRQCVEQ
jgi:DNA-binding NtrC family response regulator